jgi:hypothetical protein
LASHESDISLASVQAFPIDLTAAKQLAEKLGAQSSIDLDGLLEIELSVAEIFAKKRSGLSWSDAQFDVLLLSGVNELSIETAAHLSSRRGELQLNGISTLSDEAAEHLSKHRGRLALEGLESLSESGARFLALHRGDLLINLHALPDSVAEVLQEHPSLFPIEEPEEEDAEEEYYDEDSDSASGDASYHRTFFLDIESLMAAGIIPNTFGKWLNENVIGNAYYDFCEELYDVKGLIEQWDEHVPNYPCPESFIAPKRDYYLWVSGADLEFGKHYFGWSERPRRAEHKLGSPVELSAFGWRSI